MMSVEDVWSKISRRSFLSLSVAGLAGTYALLRESNVAPEPPPTTPPPRAFGRARRIIFLFMSGGPSSLELFDEKPILRQRQDQEIPSSVLGDQRRTETPLRLVGSKFDFRRAGRFGSVTVSTLLPHLADVVDELAIVKSMHTDAVTHHDACTLMMSGAATPGRPSIGAWLSHRLGNTNHELPAFVVLLSGAGGQPITPSYWSNGFLPGSHQGIPLQTTGEPLSYLASPPGITPTRRRRQLDALAELNRAKLSACNDPEIAKRLEAYELAYRMQTSVPSVVDLSTESRQTLEQYGAEPDRPSFAANCLAARRLAERDVRFIQLFHRDWDHHQDLPQHLPDRCREIDRPAAALIKDLKQRGLLDSTLVVWGGEFGRAPYCQGPFTPTSYGRDHHARCFTMWLAGGGVRAGITHGRTDEFGCNIVEAPVHVRDLHATLLHCLGIDHQRLTLPFQGRECRGTDMAGKVVTDLLM